MKVLKKHNRGIQTTNKIKCDKIISIVNEFYKVNCLEINRRREIVEPRQIAMYYTYSLTNLTLSAIGKLFNKDHATVLHGINVVEARMEFDRVFKEQRTELEELIFGVNFKTTDEFLLFKAKENLKELVSQMSLGQCNTLSEIITNSIIITDKKLETVKN